MEKISSKVKKIKLNAANFLKIVSNRKKKIDSAESVDVKPLSGYRPNAIASVIHPERQFVKVSEITAVTGSAKLIKLVPDKDRGTERLAPFAAGSCISVEVSIDGRTYHRPYSISSSPLEGYYEIIVKSANGGIVSNFLNDNVNAGDGFVISEPFGELTYEPLRDAKTVVGIAGGVGITPFRSFIKAISDGAENFDLILFYGIDNPSDIVLKDEFDRACSNPKIRVVYVMSGEGDVPDGFEKGFVTAELIKKYAPEGDYSVFACGPEAMYDFLEVELKKLGLRKKFIRFDYRGEPLRPKKLGDYIPASCESYKITVDDHRALTEITCGGDETLLKAMERNGIRTRTKCMSGICGYCHTKVSEGDYYMPGNRDGRRAADAVYGYIHPCCTFPRSDMVIKLP